ncbi:MAG: phosphotransferase [Microbacteriaceae bacterium]|nr:phosphotransferase [Microbacteriaceae bacterium]
MGNTLECISEWISEQRWYAGKGHVPQLRELSRQSLPSEDGVAIHLLLLMDDEGALPTLYQVPVVERRDLQPADRRFLIGQTDDGTYVFDGPHDPVFTRALLTAIAPELAATANVTGSSVLSAEQSNTSIIYSIDGAPSIICKVFRALHNGENPDVTLQSALSAAGSTAVPRFVGELSSEWEDIGQPNGRARGNLAFAQEFLSSAEDGWKVALRFAAEDSDFTSLARDLGTATAGVHATLAEVLPTAEATPEGVDAMIASFDRRLSIATREVPALLKYTDRVTAVYSQAQSGHWPRLQRIHGDFHLGQALLVTDRGWVFVDFEGEPMRPMSERDRPDVTVRDVAGMLRSFDYAAGSTDGWPTEWATACREAFLEGYCAASGFDLEAHRALLDAFELDKAVYEAIYEARNRPDWLSIPLRGIDQLTTHA